jgi:thiamine-phosphate pyrophosphorylase
MLIAWVILFMHTIKNHTLCFVLSSEYTRENNPLGTARQAIDAGIDMLQMREKHLSQDKQILLGEQLLSLCRKKPIPFIVNDNPYLAEKINADGVHLGQEDLRQYPISLAREILGHKKIVGVSTHSIAEFKAASEQDFNYIAFGPVFPTKTKDYHIGIGNIEEVLSISSKPVIFIGGINLSNVHQLRKKGVKNIAAIRAIAEADDIASTVKALKADT